MNYYVIPIGFMIGVVGTLVITCPEWVYSMFTNRLQETAAYFTIGVIIVAPLTFLIQQSYHSRKDRKQVSKSLHEELTDAKESMDGTREYPVKELDTNPNKKYYTLTFMNHDMYDSLIFSGKIQSLDLTLQQDSQDIFRRIKSHRENLKYASTLQDQAKLTNVDIEATAFPYYVHVADIEAELEELIPKLQEKLKKYF